MPQKKTPVVTTVTAVDATTKEYLRSLAQSVYDIRVIIDIHSAEKPAYWKDLEHYYDLEKERLLVLLNSSAGIEPFIFESNVLKDDMLKGNCKTKEEIDNAQLASRKLAILLSKITSVRRSNDPRFNLTQGVEDGRLKNYLLGLIDDGEKDYSRSLIEGRKVIKATQNRDTSRFAPIEGREIKVLEILEKEGEPKYITVYINYHYLNPIYILNKKYGKALYKLAQDKFTDLDTGFLDYWNTNNRNKVYKMGGYNITKIAKQESDQIIQEDGTKIKLISQSNVTRILNSTA